MALPRLSEHSERLDVSQVAMHTVNAARLAALVYHRDPQVSLPYNTRRTRRLAYPVMLAARVHQTYPGGWTAFRGHVSRSLP